MTPYSLFVSSLVSDISFTEERMKFHDCVCLLSDTYSRAIGGANSRINQRPTEARRRRRVRSRRRRTETGQQRSWGEGRELLRCLMSLVGYSASLLFVAFFELWTDRQSDGGPPDCLQCSHTQLILCVTLSSHVCVCHREAAAPASVGRITLRDIIIVG